MGILDEQKKKIKKRNAKILNRLACSCCGDDLDELLVCKKCKHHERMSALKRVEMIQKNGGKFKQLFEKYDIDNSKIYGYSEKFERDKNRTGLTESVIVGKCKVNNISFVTILMERYFMVGTLSKANGEKIARTFEYATKNNLPVVAFCTGGGVRLQEGTVGLIQMAKIDAALMKFRKKSLPFISILTDPTYGGTTASFGLMGDINIAEPNSSIGFGGKMLVKDILHEQVAGDFQSAEYVLRSGGIDMICERRRIFDTILELLDLLNKNNTINIETETPEYDLGSKRPERVLQNIRNNSRSMGIDYLYKLFDKPIILKGDRISYDDPSLLTGLGKISGAKVAFIIQNKGRNLNENIENNYGMTRPEGFRKAIRIAKLAEKFHLPILILLDSPGAHPGDDAEKNCQSIAISESMMNLLEVKTPVITIVTGEGCSGGALGLSVADALAMFSGATYSVISPESYSAIIFDKPKVQPELLASMRFTAKDLYDEGLIDEILKEGTLEYNASQIKHYFTESLMRFNKLSAKQLLTRRYNRIRDWDKK